MLHHAAVNVRHFLTANGCYKSFMRGGCELVDLCGQDEVALRQAIDFVRPDGDFHSSPSQEDVRMVALLFGESANLVDEFESFAEVRKLQGFCKVVSFHHLPSMHLLFQRGEFLTL